MNELVGELVPCRARVSPGCQELADSYDGTLKEVNGRQTVICTPCYAVLCAYSRSGRGLLSELDDAYEHWRAAHGG